jgi:hypothetical protein
VCNVRAIPKAVSIILGKISGLGIAESRKAKFEKVEIVGARTLERPLRAAYASLAASEGNYLYITLSLPRTPVINCDRKKSLHLNAESLGRLRCVLTGSALLNCTGQSATFSSTPFCLFYSVPLVYISNKPDVSAELDRCQVKIPKAWHMQQRLLILLWKQEVTRTMHPVGQYHLHSDSPLTLAPAFTVGPVTTNWCS